MINYLLVFVMTFMGAFASIFFKKASSSNGILKLIKNFNLYIGGLLYVFSALINIIVLKSLSYSVVLPLTSFTYVWSTILARFLFSEKITWMKIVGLIMIIIGAVGLALC